MRVFAVSDVHIDYEANAQWVAALPNAEFRDDVLILAGDITDRLDKLAWCLEQFSRRFRKVLFVPGNHDLWVVRETEKIDSLEKFARVCRVAEQSGASLQPFYSEQLAIVPLLGWYDYSFGAPGEELKKTWMDFGACRWPAGWTAGDICAHFLAMNQTTRPPAPVKTISFSHFLPRIDLMPWFIPPDKRSLYPVLGTSGLEAQVRQLGSAIHVYGHSHFNRNVKLDGTLYINNAYAYPQEARIAAKQLQCVFER